MSTQNIYVNPSSGGNMEIGNPIIGADPHVVLYSDSSANLAGDSQLTFDGLNTLDIHTIAAALPTTNAIVPLPKS